MTIIFLIASYFVFDILQSQSLNYNESKYEFKADGRSYNLQNPKQKWELPKSLEEISGISFYKKNQLACIQDEDGILYIYSLHKNEILREESFGDKGDYEGVEIINDTAYVLKSNGKVYYFALMQNSIGDVLQIKTDLSNKNDTEGLGYHEIQTELLVACKEDPGTKKVDIEKSRSIYRIKLSEKDFKKKPRYAIDGKSYNKMLEEKDLSKKKHKPFKPSGVAVHPKTKDVYVIGTVGKMLAILDQGGQLKDLIPLDPKLLTQPEGICFAPNGDLYISSEGRGKRGYILKF